MHLARQARGWQAWDIWALSLCFHEVEWEMAFPPHTDPSHANPLPPPPPGFLVSGTVPTVSLTGVKKVFFPSLPHRSLRTLAVLTPKQTQDLSTSPPFPTLPALSQLLALHQPPPGLPRIQPQCIFQDANHIMSFPCIKI